LALLASPCAKAGGAGLEEIEPGIPVSPAQSPMQGGDLPATPADTRIIFPEQAVGYDTKWGRHQHPIAAALGAFSREAHTTMG